MWCHDEAKTDSIAAPRTGRVGRGGDPGVHAGFPFVHDIDVPMRHDELMPDWRDVVSMATSLPAVEESTWYRTPALKVAGKGFARLRSEAEGGLVLLCELAEKEALLASGDPAFYTTPHYDGFGAIIVDLARVDPDQLGEMVTESWRRRKAPAKLRKAVEGRARSQNAETADPG